ncbi:hypothetical protein [uncultured Paludibaculum sp.]|uniref:hypothetical protein n=1 Tax=uncultured Paludibaculum sp. TaxID=1765020 RepID=UPI002AAB28BD|nr:hypothetical protein [uncultured Paludibaculum sp.]
MSHSSWVAKTVLALLAAGTSANAAGPLDFGLSEYRKALQERGLSPERNLIQTEFSMVLSEDGFSITGNIIRGGSQRGLMYGLLEAAEQIRRQGRLSAAKVDPPSQMRGIRWFLHNEELERGWYYDHDHWRAFFEMLARNRFNRFNLVFAHQTDYLAPPYPFWVEVPEFPQIRAKGLTAEQRDRNLETLKFIAQTANELGIDFTLGVWEHDIQRGMTPSVEGLTPENIGPYSYAALKLVLQHCPGIRSVQMRTNGESGIPSDRQVAFYRDYVFRALRETGRLVQLDLRGWLMQPGLMEAALNAKVPLRLSSKYWAEDLGRSYPPAETWPNYSFLNFLEKPPVTERPRLWQFYWELWGLGSHRLLLWGDPAYVKRAALSFPMSGAIGFEIDPPMAQKGFGNHPGQWDVFTEAQQNRVFWKWDWQRYWLFYTLWGRLGYNPEESDRVWLDEFQRRFGAAGKDVFEATRNASKVLNELVAVHLADPNMYIWPEINPGGLIDSYADVRPSDWRYVASFEENVRNRVEGRASAKQTAAQTAEHFDTYALATEQAVARAEAALGEKNKEWLGTKPDLDVLALLARYHGRKQRAADDLVWFEHTNDEPALTAAQQELSGALLVWLQLVKLTDGLYPENMAFGPEDIGHWKDKLPYVQHDVETVKQRVELWKRYGRVDYGFDFGAPVKDPRENSYRQNRSVEQSTVLAGFSAVSPESLFDDAHGYGWLGSGARTAAALPPVPYAEVRAVGRDPKHLPSNLLLGDSIQGAGGIFRTKVKGDEFKALLLRPDGSVDEKQLRAQAGVVDVPMPEGTWQYAGLILQNMAPPPLPQRLPKPLPKPAFEHNAPKLIAAGKPIQLLLHVYPFSNVRTVRFHYRPLNQLAQWKTMEAPPQRALFQLTAEDTDPRWDLQYYFEILNTEGSGWFFPDPDQTRPYFVATVQIEVPPPPPPPAPPPNESAPPPHNGVK